MMDQLDFLACRYRFINLEGWFVNPVCTPPFLLGVGWGKGGGGSSASDQIFKKGGAGQDLNLQWGVPEKEGVTFFQGGGGAFFT